MFRLSVPNLLSLRKEETGKFLANIENFLTDCDGVLWNRNGNIPGSREFVNRIQEKGRKVFYVTNNSFRSRKEFVCRAKNLGFKVEKDQVLCTPYLVARYLKETKVKGKVYVIGTKSITDELNLVGIEALETGQEKLFCSATEYSNRIKIENDIGAVVVGFDFFFSFPKMIKAATYLQNPTCAFVTTGLEERYPNEDLSLPGPGCFARAIESCSGRHPHLLGKPSAYVGKVMADFKLDPKKTMFIGDSCVTDIAIGTMCHYRTLLVLSGVSDLQEVKKWQEASEDSFVPDAYVNKLGDLLSFIN